MTYDEVPFLIFNKKMQRYYNSCSHAFPSTIIAGHYSVKTQKQNVSNEVLRG